MTVYYRDKISTVELRSPTASTAVDAILKPIEFTWSVDESAAPYVTATLRIPAPTIWVWSRLDPAVRPPIAITEFVHRSPVDFVGVSHGQQFMLRVYSRTRNDDNTVTLTLVGPEQDLIDYFPAATDRTNWTNQSSVALIIRNVINRVYGGSSNWVATLPAGGEQQLTGSFFTYQAATNLVANPSFQYGTAGWTGTRATVSTQNWAGGLGPDMGTTTMRLIGAGGTNADTFAAAPVNLQPNTTYTMSGYVLNGSPMSGAHSRARSLCIVATVNGTAFVLAQSNQGANTANGITRVSTTFTTPAMMDPTGATLRAYNGTTATNVVLWDGIMIVEGDGLDTDGNLLPFFDGDTVDGTGKGSGYNYDWQGDAGNSSSTRTPVLDRDPDALTWNPGQSAWDFLAPILEALGGRVFSRLGYGEYSGNPPLAAFAWVSNREVPTYWRSRAVEGDNLYSVTQVTDMGAQFSDGTPMFADAVVIRYSWTDATGSAREVFDAYPTSGYTKPWLRELNEPYPGPGRAQGLYLRLRARASMLELVTAYDPVTFPSTQISVTSSRLGGTFLGVIDSVEHDPYNGRSTIRTKSAISYPTNAWVTKTTPWSALAGSWAAQ